MTGKLYILCGIPFSGKTTLAKYLKDIKGCIHIDLDEIKTSLMGTQTQDEDIKQSDWDKIYKIMYQDIETALKNDQTVIHDTGNFTRHERSLVSQLAVKQHSPFTTIYVDTSVELARQRLLANRSNPIRFNISDKEFESAVAEMEPPTAAENTLIYNGSISAEEWLEENQL